MRIVLSSGPFAGGACTSMSEDMRLVKHSFGDGPLVDSQTSPLQREPFNHIRKQEACSGDQVISTAEYVRPCGDGCHQRKQEACSGDQWNCPRIAGYRRAPIGSEGMWHRSHVASRSCGIWHRPHSRTTYTSNQGNRVALPSCSLSFFFTGYVVHVTHGDTQSWRDRAIPHIRFPPERHTRGELVLHSPF